jgi:hypothetical protein
VFKLATGEIPPGRNTSTTTGTPMVRPETGFKRPVTRIVVLAGTFRVAEALPLFGLAVPGPNPKFVTCVVALTLAGVNAPRVVTIVAKVRMTLVRY